MGPCEFPSWIDTRIAEPLPWVGGVARSAFVRNEGWYDARKKVFKIDEVWVNEDSG
jgi:hypothetical protein